MFRIALMSLLVISVVACKQEPTYQLKDPYGSGTMSAVTDEFDDVGVDVLKVRRKNFDRQKYNEKRRKDYALNKLIKNARKWDPKDH